MSLFVLQSTKTVKNSYVQTTISSSAQTQNVLVTDCVEQSIIAILAMGSTVYSFEKLRGQTLE